MINVDKPVRTPAPPVAMAKSVLFISFISILFFSLVIPELTISLVITPYTSCDSISVKYHSCNKIKALCWHLVAIPWLCAINKGGLWHN